MRRRQGRVVLKGLSLCFLICFVAFVGNQERKGRGQAPTRILRRRDKFSPVFALGFLGEGGVFGVLGADGACGCELGGQTGRVDGFG